MKKKLAVLLAAVMALGVIGGCGKKEEAKDVPVADLDTSKYVTLGAYSGLEVTVAPVIASTFSPTSLSPEVFRNCARKA